MGPLTYAILPGVLKRLDRNQSEHRRAWQRRCLGDGYGFGGAGAIPSASSDRSRRTPTIPARGREFQCRRFRFGEHADLPFFVRDRGDEYHDARIGVRCARMRAVSSAQFANSCIMDLWTTVKTGFQTRGTKVTENK